MAGLEGQKLGNYEIEAKLGQGGMGAVYKARDTRLQRCVAIKILPAQLATDEEFVQRFQREAIAAAQFCHSNLVQVFDIGESNDLHFIIMELVEGESLAHRLERKGRMAPREAVAITTYIGQALAYAWNKAKLIHRDIKPANIFLSKDGEVKLGDLGLAKSLQDAASGLTLSGTIMGTPHYMSPEQGRGDKQLDCRSDIYSLGCVLYHMLTGDPPYQGESTATLIYKHVHEAPPALRQAAPGCPEALAETVDWMMAKKPEDRPQTYEELLAELAAVRHALLHAPAVAPKPAEAKAAAPKPAEAKAVAPKPVPGKAVTHEPVTMAQKKALASETKSPSFGMIMTITAVVSVLALGLFLWSPWASKPSPVKRPPSAAVTQRPPAVPVTVTSEAFIKEVAALPAEQQVKRVVAELKRLNPGFDPSTVKHKIGGRQEVCIFGFCSSGVTNLAPVRALTRLYHLDCSGPQEAGKRSPLQDLSPLRGLPLTYLLCYHTEVADLSPLRGMLLKSLSCFTTHVKDLTPLQGMPLEALNCMSSKVDDLTPLGTTRQLQELVLYGNLRVQDLAPLRGLPLKSLTVSATGISDLSPLAGMPLERFVCDPYVVNQPANAKVLRSITTLASINKLPAAEFWQQVDAGKASVTDDAAWQNAINLLPLMDPQQDAVRGRWSMQAGELVGGDEGGNLANSRVGIPYRPPEEYDFLVEFTRKFNSGGIAQIVVGGGRQFSLVAAALDRRGFGFERIGGRAMEYARTSVLPGCIQLPVPVENGLRHSMLVQVRKDGVKGIFDGRFIAEWKTDFQDTSLSDGWQLKDGGVLGLYAHTSWLVFHRIEVREVTGKGTFTRGAPMVLTPSSTADDAFIKVVAALPAEQQVQRVVAELKKLNPGFDGQETHKIENGQITELSFSTVAVADISPVRALTGLRTLACIGKWPTKGALADLTPLQRLKLEDLRCDYNPIRDLAPLKGMPLTTLYISSTLVNDLTPLRGLPLEQLNVNGTPLADLAPLSGGRLRKLLCTSTGVSDLRPLQGLRLTHLAVNHTKVTDFGVLRGLPLEECQGDFVPQRDAALLRSITTLKKINGQPAAAFWAQQPVR